MSGTGLTGAIWQVDIQQSGQPAVSYSLRFDKIQVDASRPEGDVYLYDVSYAVSGSTAWVSLCADAAGNPVPAIPLSHRWDPQSGARIDDASAVTLACVSGALGKCVRLGYRPWVQAQLCRMGQCSTVSLADHHQACTRLIRADYCGSGTPYTTNGTLIEVYDGLSPQIQANTMNWDLEAEWTPAGATCMSEARHAELLAMKRSPDCKSDGQPRVIPQCGSRPALLDALLVSTFK